MNLPIRRVRYIGLGPESESAVDLALPPNVAVEGTQNLRVTKEGGFRRVKGYTQETSSPVTSTNGQAMACVGLYDYDYEGTRRVVGVFDDGTDEVEVHHSTDGGATWSKVGAVGAGAVGEYPVFAQWNEQLFITFGASVAVQVYDGSSLAAAGQTQPSGMTAETGTYVSDVNTLNGTYKYKYQQLDANGAPGPASAEVVVNVQDEQVRLSGFTVGSYGVRISRTFRNSAVFFTLDDTSLSPYIDRTTDADLLNEGDEIERIGDPPPSGSRFAQNHRSRIYYVGSAAEPNGIFPSEIGYPDEVFADSVEQIGEGVAGDELSGVFGPYNGELIIAKLKSMWRLQGAGRSDWYLIRTEASTGVAAERTVIPVPPGALFHDAKGGLSGTGRGSYAYLTPKLDIRVFDGTTDLVVSWDKQETLQSVNLAARRAAFAVEYPAYDWILFFLPTGASTVPNTVIAWDYARGYWHTLEMLPTVTAAALVETSTGGYELLAGTNAGHVLKVFNGWSADGSDVTAIFRLRPQDFGKPDVTKFLRGLDPVFDPPASTLEATLRVYEGFADTGATAFWEEVLEMAGTNERATNPEYIEPKTGGDYPMDEAFVIEVENAGQKEWGLKELTVAFQELPETITKP